MVVRGRLKYECCSAKGIWVRPARCRGQLRQAGKIVEQRRVILDFDKELLTRVRGDVVPQVKSGADTGDSHVVSAPITVEPKPKEESILDKLKFWKKDGKVDAQPAIAATIATEAKEEVVKPETKSKAEEKSLLDKLKFRKKDELVVAPEKVAPASPRVVLPAEAAAVVIPESSETATPSLLVVPVELPPAGATKEKPVMVGPTQTEPLEAEPVVPAKAIPAPEKVAPKSHDSPPAKELTAKPELKKPLSMTAKQGDPLIFRMDRSLNLHRPDEVKPAALAPTASTPEVNKSKAIKTDSAPLPDEAEPSYFDKLLEKIGF